MSHDISFIRKGVYADIDINVTYNLGKMMKQAGCHVGDLHGKQASECILTVKLALARLTLYPDYYNQFNASNGWGTRETAVHIYNELIEAINSYPDYIISL